MNKNYSIENTLKYLAEDEIVLPSRSERENLGESPNINTGLRTLGTVPNENKKAPK